MQLQLTDEDLHSVLFIIHLARRMVGAQVAQMTSACRLKLPPVGRGQFGTCCFCNTCHGVDLQLPYTSTFELLPVQLVRRMEQDDHDGRRSPRGIRVGLLLDE